MTNIFINVRADDVFGFRLSKVAMDILDLIRTMYDVFQHATLSNWADIATIGAFLLALWIWSNGRSSENK